MTHQLIKLVSAFFSFLLWQFLLYKGKMLPRVIENIGYIRY